MRAFVTGGTGLVGGRLVARLRERGDTAIVLSRSAAKARARFGDTCEVVEGDPTTAGSWQKQIDGCDAVVNLAGENLFARRWSDNFKILIRESRVRATTNVVTAIAQAQNRPRVLVNGSAVGYYGFHGDQELTEESPAGDDFLARTCVAWEDAAKPVEQSGVRLAFLRTGVVLAKAGGALQMMLLPFKLFLFGGKTGSGRQWVSWIHHDDEVGLILFAMDNAQVRGPLNATAPVPVTNLELAKAIGQAMGRPSFMPTPGFMLRLGLGEVADLVVKGQRVVPQKAQELGYAFRFPEINAALRDILG
jgi:hypothetical protein